MVVEKRKPGNSNESVKKMKNIKIFLPLLIIYFGFTLISSKNEFVQDEGRYVQYATNLSNGYYADGNLNIVNGPGYPIVLLPFVLLKIKLIYAKLLNCAFLFLGLVYIYKTISNYVSKRNGLIIIYAVGLFPLLLINLIYLQSDALAFFLVCGFCYHLHLFLNTESINWKSLLITSFYMSSIALTRTIFGYVILFSLLIIVSVFIFKRKNYFKKTILVFVLSLIFCLPYLIYTFSLTGKLYYWSTNGGDTVYWLSTPYEYENGDWYAPKVVFNTGIIKEEHRIFFRKIDSLNAIQKDEAFRAVAISNIVNHPQKFIKNWLSNVGRFIFNYPYTYDPFNNSYDRQKITTYMYMLPNMFLFVLLIISFYIAFKARRILSHEILILSLIGLIYIWGSTLASAIIRFFLAAIPFIIIWLSYIYSSCIKITICSNTKDLK
jgi:hypothetical protein